MSQVRQPVVSRTAIQGLVSVELPVHGDDRGWFKENWQREKMIGAGLPDFRPVQNNVSFNSTRGTTRGFHAEPWDKYVSVAAGEIFGAWVDLRPGPGFGAVHTSRMGPGQAMFVPRGVANAFQTLTDDTVYSYLVTEHWSEAARSRYSYVNLADPHLGVQWPIGLHEAVLSQADRDHPFLDQVKPVEPKPIAVLGSTGQLGRALARLAPSDPRLTLFDRAQVNLEDPEAVSRLDLSGYSHVINAAAMTAVDLAETPEGRKQAWQVNAAAVASLARACAESGVSLIHVSTDYVFDGAQSEVAEDQPMAPLGAYGQSKAAGELAVLCHPGHYVLRTSWVIGEGVNFVTTMRRLASQKINPAVVDDQIGRLTFADDLARGILHLIDAGCEPGVYHLQGGGEPASWYEVACRVFELSGNDPSRVGRTSTREYAQGREVFAPRPSHSTFNMDKLRSTGFDPEDQWVSLAKFMGVRVGTADRT